mmetsp:Transcript_9001/g.33153  ORF Transcript_9001/g.33153 Transcript_9001/m.33153 type:complete len:256 (-) Transcript_9001:200-967(-)
MKLSLPRFLSSSRSRHQYSSLEQPLDTRLDNPLYNSEDSAPAGNHQRSDTLDDMGSILNGRDYVPPTMQGGVPSPAVQGAASNPGRGGIGSGTLSTNGNRDGIPLADETEAALHLSVLTELVASGRSMVELCEDIRSSGGDEGLMAELRGQCAATQRQLELQLQGLGGALDETTLFEALALNDELLAIVSSPAAAGNETAPQQPPGDHGADNDPFSADDEGDAYALPPAPLPPAPTHAPPLQSQPSFERPLIDLS